MIQTVVRKHKFDAGHRVMHERFKCNNLHGHEYHIELIFTYETPKALGYAMDFKEIKRVACAWIDDHLDHAFICNPKDEKVIELSKELNSKYYVMNLVDSEGFCNPSAENIAKELFFIISILMNQIDETKFKLSAIKLHETTNCFVFCEGVSDEEWSQMISSPVYKTLVKYRNDKGVLEYDDRCV